MRLHTNAALAAALLLAACVPPAESAWVQAEPRYASAQSGFELVPPAGWMRLGKDDADTFVATKDGVPLQRIVVGSIELGKPLGKGGKRVARAGMTPDELAELVTDYVRGAETVTELAVLENAPASVAGREGFRLVASYRDPAGLRRRVAFYGVIAAERFYELMYSAPERVYFARDLPAFEEVARTFRLTPPKPRSAAASAARPPAPPATTAR